MADILITEEASGPAIEALKSRWQVEDAPGLWREPAALRQRVRGARALMVRNQTVADAALLAAAERLEVIGRIGVGMDNIDLAVVRARGIVVCYAAEENAVSVAEHVFALLLALARKIPAADRSVREGRWERAAHTGFELHGKMVAVLGLGRIGLRVALRARAFGMKVLAYDPFLSPQQPGGHGDRRRAAVAGGRPGSRRRGHPSSAADGRNAGPPLQGAPARDEARGSADQHRPRRPGR